MRNPKAISSQASVAATVSLATVALRPNASIFDPAARSVSVSVAKDETPFADRRFIPNDYKDIDDHFRAIISSGETLYSLIINRNQQIENFLVLEGVEDPDCRRVIAEAILHASSRTQASIASDKVKPMYKNRKNDPDRSELSGANILQWLRAVWGDELKHGGLTRVELRNIDPSADKAVENWLREQPLPPDIHLPTKKEVIDSLLASLPAEALRDGERLAAAYRRRKKVGLAPY